ncbi:hypothetical protein DB31_0127 [Hyalangium minutum]|uniref:Uncharacterized protein n=1 Tax=Hyalangium minutum TaxID=394096 RepID=A0A085WW03_9BACT|nr:hypothetical protein DB31_0127 [Hyalangium minutum]
MEREGRFHRPGRQALELRPGEGPYLPRALLLLRRQGLPLPLRSETELPKRRSEHPGRAKHAGER